MVVNQQALNTLKVGFSMAFNKGHEEVKKLYDKVATTTPSQTAEQEYPWLGQLPGMREWIGEREIAKLSAHGYTIKNKLFEQTIGVPRETIEDDTYGVFTPMFQSMGESAATHPEEMVWDCLKAGFESKCYDGQAFFSAAHTVDKKTYSNLSDKKLTTESYEVARKAIMSVRGEANRPLGLIPNLLVVGPDNEGIAKRILESEIVDSSSNVWKGTAEALVVPWLADKPGAWFLLCTMRALKPILYQVRRPIKFQSFTNEHDPNVFLRGEYLYGADGRDNVGYGFWQMAYGSTGTKA